MADITDQHDQTSPTDLDEAHSVGNGSAAPESRGVKRARPAQDDDDDDDEKGGRERRKIEIKFISDKSRRHITFSKRKAGIMKKVRRQPTLPLALNSMSPASLLATAAHRGDSRGAAVHAIVAVESFESAVCQFGLQFSRVPASSRASFCDPELTQFVQAYELSVLTGTQVLLLVVSETGLVYTFTTPKLQPLVTKAEGKNLIQVRDLAQPLPLRLRIAACARHAFAPCRGANVPELGANFFCLGMPECPRAYCRQ